jgi:hypothetical protein
MRCTAAFGVQKAFYVNTKTKRCACSKGACSQQVHGAFESWAIVKDAMKCSDKISLIDVDHGNNFQHHGCYQSCECQGLSPLLCSIYVYPVHGMT